ncbi:MAG: DUF4352 domain-containing protein [Acidimicrobiales bacterium]
MQVEPTTSRTAHRGAAALRRSLFAVVAAALMAGCVLPGSEEADDASLDVERPLRESGDVEGRVDDPLEVYGITATVTEVGRVDEYNEFDTWGYIWARVRVENTTSREIDFHRRQFQLEKPDETVSNTASISTETQIEGSSVTRPDVLAPGETGEGQVIYTVGDLDGQFALIYRPDPPSEDVIDAERGVWVFESSPQDAE